MKFVEQPLTGEARLRETVKNGIVKPGWVRLCVRRYRSLRLINVNNLYFWLRVYITQIPIRHVLIRITYHHVHRVTQSLFCTFGTNKFHRTQDVFIFTTLYDCIADNAVIGIKEHQDEG